MGGGGGGREGGVTGVNVYFTKNPNLKNFFWGGWGGGGGARVSEFFSDRIQI